MFSLQVALRFLKKNKTQTIFIILGIAIGVSVQVFVGSLINGLQSNLLEETVGNISHVTIFSNSSEDVIEDWQPIVDQITETEGIARISTIKEGGGLITNSSSRLPVLLRGFDLEKDNEIFGYYNDKLRGEKPNGLGEVLIGSDLAEEYYYEIGDFLNITIDAALKIYDEVKIVGIFDTGVKTVNLLWLITNNNTVEEMFNLGNNISQIAVQIDEVFDAPQIAEEIRNFIANNNYIDIKVSDWTQDNEGLESALQGQSISSIMIQVFVLASVLIGIASVLAISVMQKSKQIGILKAMGITNRQAASIFLFQGFAYGIFGAIAGILLGLGLSYMFTLFAVNPDGEPLIPLYLDPIFISVSGLISLVVSMGASLIPAKKSSKLSVVEIIRGD